MTDVRSICAIGQRGQLGLARPSAVGRREGRRVHRRRAALLRHHARARAGGRAEDDRVGAALRVRRPHDRRHPLDRPARGRARALSGPRRLHRRRAAGVGRLRAVHPALGHHAAAVRRAGRPLVRPAVAGGGGDGSPPRYPPGSSSCERMRPSANRSTAARSRCRSSGVSCANNAANRELVARALQVDGADRLGSAGAAGGSPRAGIRRGFFGIVDASMANCPYASRHVGLAAA